MQPLKLRFKKTRQFAIVAKWLLDSASHSFEAIPTNMTTSGSGLKAVSQRVKRLTEQNVIAKPHGLTYKSFVDAACKKAGLRAYEIYLRPTQKAWRYVFATEAFVAWIGARLPEIAANHEPDEDPLNIQVEAELSGFCYGYELSSTFRILTRVDQVVAQKISS